MTARVEIVSTERPGAFNVLVGGRPQSHVDLDDPLRLPFDYVRRMADVVDVAAPSRKPLRVVHVGGAGLSLPRYIAATRPTSAQIVLEPDTELTELVRAELPLPRRSGIKVRGVDGREGVATLRDRSAELLLLDAYDDGLVPRDLLTLDFSADVQRLLEPSGLFVLNLVDRAPFTHTRRVVAGLVEVFADLALSAEQPTLRGRRDGNLVVVATGGRVPLGAMRRRAATSAAPYRVLDARLVSDSFGGGRPFLDG